MGLRPLAVSVFLVVGAACAKATPELDAGCRPSGLGPPAQVVFGGARPVTLSVPRAYDAACPAPLLVLLHGYGASGVLELGYLGLGGLVDGRGVLLAAPDGTLDRDGNPFWDVGISACCNFTGSPVDDVTYLRELIAEIRAVYSVDPRRIFVMGHSNGGFMAHRLGCELSNEVAAVVSLAGTTPPAEEGCHATSPVSVLQIHGDQDRIVLYDGGTDILGKGGGGYAGAAQTVARWAHDVGCEPTTTPGPPLDLEATLPGAETAVSNADGCPAGIDVTLWTIQGGSHSPQFAGKLAAPLWRWLDAHHRR